MPVVSVCFLSFCSRLIRKKALLCLVTSLCLWMLLSPNKATLAQSCLPPKHDPGIMKLCALPNCQGSFTPWYLVPLPLLLFLGCSRLTFCYRLSHSQPVVYLSIQPPDFTTPFDVINQSSTAREKEREWEKIWNVSKEWPTKDLHL